MCNFQAWYNVGKEVGLIRLGFFVLLWCHFHVNAKGMVYKIDSLTGNISEFYNIEATVSSAIMIGANGTLYLGDDKGTFWIIGSDGKLLDSCNFGSAIVGMPAMDKTGNIYIGTKNTFYVLTSKMESNISVDVQNINVGDNATIIATLPANATGNVTFTVNNKEYIVAIENGSAKLNVENLLSGTYDVLVRFMGDNNYLPSENNASFIVSKVPTNMNIAVDNINVGEDAVINITLPNEISNELVSVTIDGKSYTVLINNGKGSLILSNLVANSYPITAKYDGNYKYTEGENSTTLTVAKMSSAVNVTANNIKFGEEAVINIAVPNVSLGVATVVVNGKSYNVAIVDEKGVLNIYNLAAGDYNVDVTYLGDNKYLSSTNAANFTVSKVSDYNMTVDIADIVKGENATITVTIPEDGTGSVIVTINGTDYNGTVIKGIAKVIIPGLDEGSYKVVTFYTGDNKYDSMVVNGTITVNKNTITTLIMDDVVKYFGGSQKLIAKLVDGFGNPIANATVYFTINGGVYARITDENGTASIAIRLLPGEYKASALFNGTGDYDMVAVNASVLVKNTILGNDTTLYFRNGTQYVAKFLDGNGKALTNTDVKFNINGVFYTRVTDENGIARLNIRLDPASYIITAYNPVTGEQKANEVTVLPRIIAEDLSMKYLDGSSFNATLVDGQGKAVAGVNITFNVNGVFYHRTTDANGVARLNIRLMPGDYIITSMYDECWASNKIIISA